MNTSPSPIIGRFLDRTRHMDYVLAFVIAAVPIPLSFVLDVAADFGVGEQRFDGYLSAYNFLSLTVILPALLWFVRWAMGRIASIAEPWPPATPPPLIELIDTPRGKQAVYTDLRRKLLSRQLARIAILLTVAIHVADMGEMVIGEYLLDAPASERDWTVMYKAGEAHTAVTKVDNAIFVVFAYAVQFLVVFVSVLFGLLLIVHNAFFLRRIYQRRWVPDGDEEFYIHIDLADGDRCFGFRRANDCFNAQVLVLVLGGIAMLVSRFQHTVTWAQLARDPGKILPEIGQGILAFGWLAGFLVVCSPALVKLLPRFPVGGKSLASRSVTNYLREFIAPERWPFGRDPSPEEIGALAAHFASNAFWPTGNNRASQLFFFATWVGLVVFFAPPIDHSLWLLLSLVVLGVFAYFGKNLLFHLLDTSLSYVDHRLVELPAGDLPALRLPGRRLDTGVFISYRRGDSAAYTGRLYDYLTDNFQRDRIFMDIDTIAAGEKFPEALDRALASSAVVIVMIGPRWGSMQGKDGTPRVHDPGDWVRSEVATALKRNVMVVPVLVGGAEMPSAQDLPADLALLCERNAAEISDRRWDYDARRLMDAIRAALDRSRRSER